MPTSIVEIVGSRDRTLSVSDNTATLRYIVTGTYDEAEVVTLLTSTHPTTFYDMVIQSVKVNQHPSGGDNWECTVNYGLEVLPELEAFKESFDTTGASEKITNSLATIASYPASAPDFKGAIGVNGDSVDGVEITSRKYDFQYTYWFPNATVTDTFKANIYTLTGTVNNATFKGFQAGEVLFLGASGAPRDVQSWEITFKFSASPNVSSLTVGDITGIAKKGWEYLWIRYKDDVDENTLVKVPAHVYVEQVYKTADFSLLGIGT